MGLRDFNRARRSGIKWWRRTSRIPVPRMLWPEYNEREVNGNIRERYLERLGLGNFSPIAVRLYQRAQRQRRREELGHRMVRARYILTD